MRWLTIAGYALVALLLFVVFVFVTLPTDVISQWLLRRAEVATGIRIHAVAVERLYPLGLRWLGVSIDKPAGPGGESLSGRGPGGRREWVNFSSVSVEPLLPSLLSRRKVVRVEAKHADGVIEGVVELARLPPTPQVKDGALWRVDLTRVEGVDLAVLQPLIPTVKALSGRLSGTFSYEWSARDPLFGTGTVFVNVRQMAMSGKFIQMMPVEEIRFDEATCGVALTGGRATISNCSARGPMGRIDVSGTAQLQLPVSRTLLSLRAEVKWQGLGSAPLVANVSGPIGAPDVTMEGGVTLGPGTRGGSASH
ncbi:MAG TPA: type II secretion system protein GspN [Nitrospiria bacterium]|nr:type II secretion system protein GspN [Nitrospiria bacterium]